LHSAAQPGEQTERMQNALGTCSLHAVLLFKPGCVPHSSHMLQPFPPLSGTFSMHQPHIA
jgi:hypothetical protein